MGKGKTFTFQPFCLYDAMGYVRQVWLAAERNGETVKLLLSDTTRLELHTRDIAIGQCGPVGGRTRYIVSEQDPSEMAEVFKRSAMKYGATPEAIRLLGRFAPITKEELSIMADKKLAPKKGDAEALKNAAKAAPVGGGKAAPAKAAPKGNPAALEKARAVNAAKAEELKKDKRKITATEKGSAKIKKSGDPTDKLAIMVKAKTVGAAITGGEVAFKDIAYAEKVGLIELS